jgi:hypothetical protein
MSDQVKTSSQEPNIIVINKVHAETDSGRVGVAGLACAFCACALSGIPNKTAANLVHYLCNRGRGVAASARTGRSHESGGG